MEKVRYRTRALVSYQGNDCDAGEIAMETYPKAMERRMHAFYRTLSEKERRRYAAIEADKLGHGGIDYISHLFEIDPKTIRRGLDDLNDKEALSDARQRKKGADGKARSNNIPS
jgi:hypothetical protein